MTAVVLMLCQIKWLYLKNLPLIPQNYTFFSESLPDNEFTRQHLAGSHGDAHHISSRGCKRLQLDRITCWLDGLHQVARQSIDLDDKVVLLVGSDEPELTLEEINAEIAAARAERKVR